MKSSSMNNSLQLKEVYTHAHRKLRSNDKYLAGESAESTSSTINGQEKSPSSKSSWKDNLLELLEKPTRGEPLDESNPENRPESSLASLDT